MYPTGFGLNSTLEKKVESIEDMYWGNAEPEG
jgi:hypothetical protein